MTTTTTTTTIPLLSFTLFFLISLYAATTPEEACGLGTPSAWPSNCTWLNGTLETCPVGDLCISRNMSDYGYNNTLNCSCPDPCPSFPSSVGTMGCEHVTYNETFCEQGTVCDNSKTGLFDLFGGGSCQCPCPNSTTDVAFFCPPADRGLILCPPGYYW